MNRRIGVFVFYDLNGQVSDYVSYLLNNILPFLERLIIVCNGKLDEHGKKIFLKYTTEIFIRENKNYDGGAYKYVLESILGRETLEQYDELLLFNDTFYGPFYPFHEVFNKMEKTDNDIWGLSMHGKAIINCKKKPAHIQSYFIVIKNIVLRSDTFWEFWSHLHFTKTFDEAVENFEIAFSETMENAGFKLGSYLYIPKYQNNNYEDNYNYSQLNSYECISKYHFPIFKRKNLTNSIPISLESRLTLDYIQKNTNYPIEYIWQDVIRKNRLASIQLSTGFDDLLLQASNDFNTSKACIIVYIDNIDFYKDIVDYLIGLSEEYVLFVFVSADLKDAFKIIDKDIFVKKYTVLGSFWKNLILHIKDFESFEYIGICCDNKCYKEYDTVTKRIVRKLIMDSCFMNANSVASIISYFIKNTKLGICLPQDYSAEYWKYIINDSTKKLLYQYLNTHGISFEMVENEPPFCGADSFWIRQELLKNILYGYEDKYADIWGLLLPYLIQSKGFYPQILLHEKQAAAQIADYKRTMWLVSEQMKELWHYKNELLNELRVVETVSLYSFLKLYIYGCGKVADIYSTILEKYNCQIAGYIVSDGEKNEQSFHNHPVYELSKFSFNDNTIVLIGVGVKLRPTIIELLHKHGVQKILCVDSTNLFENTRQKNNERFEIYEKIMHQNFLQQLAIDAAPYEYGPYHPPMKSSEELLELLISSGKSLSRFGDGEFQLMQNQARPWFQKPDRKLAERLKEVFYKEKTNTIIAIPDILGDLRKYKPADQANIRYYLKDNVRENLLNIVGTERVYYDAYVSRPYLIYQDSEHGKRVFNLFKKLWHDKHVLLVEGEYARSGVGNDLFDNVRSMKRIICPSQNAFQYYDEILNVIKGHMEDINLILCVLGPTATVLAYDLAETGIQAIDLGQIDNEYEWCKMGALERVPISGKAVPEIEGQHQTDDSTDKIYLSQIIQRIRC